MSKKSKIETRDWVTGLLALMLIATNIIWYSYSESQDTVNQSLQNSVQHHESEIRDIKDTLSK